MIFVSSFLLLFNLLIGSMAFSQETEEPLATGEEEILSEVEEVPKQMTEEELRKIAEEKARHRREQCKKHEGKHIAYYGEVFKVKNCLRIKLDPEDIYEVTRAGKRITPVDGLAIESLEEKSFRPKDEVRSCKVFNNRYITYRFGAVYFVKNCQKRAFSDWASYEVHSQGKKARKAILSVSWAELSHIKEGKPFPSNLDEEHRKALAREGAPDVIPVDEACEGVEGRYVSYYSRIYKIQTCRKREIDANQFVRKNIGKLHRELTAEQWISLPDGKPIRLKK